MDRMRCGKMVWLAAALLTGVILRPAAAQMPDGLLGQLKLKIDAELRSTVNGLVTPEKMAEELFLKWPVAKPTATPDSLTDKAADMVAREAKQQYPFALVTEYEEKAAKEYALYQPGQRITVTLKSGESVTGHLRQKTRSQITIDNQPIRLDQLDEQSSLHFNEFAARQKIRALVRAETARLDGLRRDYERTHQEARERELYEAAGYIQVLGEWLSRAEYLASAVEERREALAKRLRPLLKIKTYRENGLVYYNDTWMTEADAAEQKRLLAEAREAEEAARRAAQEQLHEGPGTATGSGEKTPKTPGEGHGGGLWD